MNEQQESITQDYTTKYRLLDHTVDTVLLEWLTKKLRIFKLTMPFPIDNAIQFSTLLQVIKPVILGSAGHF